MRKSNVVLLDGDAQLLNTFRRLQLCSLGLKCLNLTLDLFQ